MPSNLSRLLCCQLLLLGLATAAPGPSGEPLWLRYPAVSPDGAAIAFTYGGRIWRVAASGGEAVPLTGGDYYSTRPVWSSDGSQIAFAAKRHGNLDVFVMPAAGGTVTRLTANSANDRPYAFSPDGKMIYFASDRLGSPESIHSGTYANSDQLYAVPAMGGRTRLVLPTPALEVSVNAGGDSMLYENRPVYENEWRKGSVSDAAHDIWLYDLKSQTHRKLTDFRGEDRDPVWAPDGRSYYFLSERSGSFNVWRSSPRPGARSEQITHHRHGAVRFVSVARDGSLVYGFEGELWRQPPDHGRPQRVSLTLRQDRPAQKLFPVDGNDHLGEFAISPDGGQVAVIARGEVHVLSTRTGTTRRITFTPEHERHVSFGPDGRSLVYVSERDGDMDIFQATLGDATMIDFASPGPIIERKLVDTVCDVLHPLLAPDGRSLAYLADRKHIVVRDLETGKEVTALPAGFLYSYIDDDVSFAWSPDSRWLTASAGSIVTNQDIVLLDATGRLPPRYVTRSAYNDGAPVFSPDGQAVLWMSGREGLRQADATTGQLDIFMAWLTREAYDAAHDKTAVAAKRTSDTSHRGPPQLAGIEHRTERLTPFSGMPVFFGLNASGTALIVVDLDARGHVTGRQVDVLTGQLKELFTRPTPDAAYTADTSLHYLFSLGNGTVERIELATGASKSFTLNAPLEVDPNAEMAYWFNHFWRMTKFKFYEPTMHGRDWDALREHYARFLPHLDTWEDFAEMMSEMAGELNASHMGCSFLKPSPGADSTASLGLYVDDAHTGPGLRVATVLPGGPADFTGSLLQPGAVILTINDDPINEGTDADGLLNAVAGTKVRLKVQPAGGSEPVVQSLVPITQNQAITLAYERWVDERKSLTSRLSGGRIGYVHIPDMHLAAYKRVYSEVMGDHRNKDALIIDIRYNRGGNLHDQLITLFTGEVVAGFTSRAGEIVGRIPTGRWSKPTALLQNSAAYSDGSIFPHLYRRQKLGPVIGDRVPGTGTAVWWMFVMNNALKWGIPQLGAKDFDSGWFENQEIKPTLQVTNDPGAIAAGRDPQLEAAVSVLLRSLPVR